MGWLEAKGLSAPLDVGLCPQSWLGIDGRRRKRFPSDDCSAEADRGTEPVGLGASTSLPTSTQMSAQSFRQTFWDGRLLSEPP